MKNKVLIPIILSCFISGCSLNNNRDNLIWIDSEYSIDSYIGIEYEDFMKKILPDNERIIIEAYRNADDHTRDIVNCALQVKELIHGNR